ncbi:X-ray repair cross-complementing protein 5 isoform X2 [Salvelinus fontinalis]|uniref:X-ray repair cross-complementing protein 5 isoform X2 n=1 Tax=Salvelinus fontinalis TaxID=8038 RepID=UPI002484E266|nr:X-ray repair cross-complementing protein 5 isoform X2 [Salvelinus fontinalis]
MSNSAPGQEPPFQQAKKVIQKFVQRQVFAENKDELGLVLFGSDNTKNNLAKDGQYQNISVHRHLMIPNFELLEEIQNDVHPGSQQADWLDALVVCMDLLQNETLGKKYERLNIVLLTDLNTPSSPDQLDIIIGNLKRAGITLQFFLPFPVDGGGPNPPHGGYNPPHGGPNPPHGGKGLSREQQQGLEMTKQVMMSLDEEDGLEEVYTFSDAIEKLSVFKRVEKRPMAWPCTLTIGSSLAIKIVGYKAVCEERPRKSWSVVDAQTHQKDDIKRDVVYCLNDDEETEVSKDDTIQGYRYGSDIVPFSKVDQDQMKYKTDGKSFAVLGFTKQSMINRHQFVGTQVLKVFAPKDDECLVYVQLPFMEDLRQYSFPSLESNKKYTPSEDQLAAMDSLIDSMMLVEEDEDGENKDLFKVNHIPNPQYQRLFQCLHHRAVNPSAPLPPMDPWLTAALQRPLAVATRCQAPLETLKKKFPLKEVVKKKELKTSKELFGNSTEDPDAKKAKVDEEEDFNLADITEGSITQVGSVDPARDFRTLIRQKSLPFGEVCQQLTGRIEQLLGNKNMNYYIKCIPCIQTFREQSVQVGNADHYNSYIQSLKTSIPVRGLQEFWDMLVQDALTLINKDEVEGSTFSSHDAKQFLTAEEKKEEVVAAVVDDTGDVDDLLDMM